MSEITDVFDPVLYSKEENSFLLDALGKPPVVAGREVPAGVNPRAVLPVIRRIYELIELEQHEGMPWIGVAAVKASIRTFLEQDAKWERDAQKSKRAPRFPSLYSYDAKGRPHIGGPGSDAGRVRTYFDEKGRRVPFAIDLVPDNKIDWVAPTIADEQPSVGGYLVKDAENHRWECRVPVGESVCGHTESWKEGSRSSENAARARMSKHLRKASDSAEIHREVHTNEFGE